MMQQEQQHITQRWTNNPAEVLLTGPDISNDSSRRVRSRQRFGVCYVTCNPVCATCPPRTPESSLGDGHNHTATLGEEHSSEAGLAPPCHLSF